HRLRERQRLEFDRVELAQTLLGQVSLSARLVDPPVDDVGSVGVGIEDADAVGSAIAHLVQAAYRRGLDAFDLCSAEPALHDAPDSRLIGRGKRWQHAEEDCKYAKHRISLGSQRVAWRTRMFFKTGRRSVRFNPALRSRASPAPRAPK